MKKELAIAEGPDVDSARALTLVDDAKVPVVLGILVWEDDVDLVALERGLVPVVLDADSEPAAIHDRLAQSSRGTSWA